MLKTQCRTGKYAFIASALLLTAGGAGADTGVPLYVADSGRDSGDCSDATQPCRSIGYALQVAGKNANIRVASGTYTIDDPLDAIHMVSGAVQVTGGYTSEAAPGDTARSVLTGVPLEYRAVLKERGFHVIVDSKADTRERDTHARDLLHRFLESQLSASAAPCAGGQANGFSCNEVDLLAQVALSDISATPNQAMDVWGFVDLNTHREYVIVGVGIGTAIFDVTDPTAPREVGFVDGQNANWRDIKVHQTYDTAAGRWRAYAYVTTDGSSDGLFVIDLSGLPHSIERIPYASDFANAHNVYLTNTEYATGLRLVGSREPQVVIAGSGVNAGQFRNYSLANPTAPLFVQRIANADYMHDAASAIIDDARAAQCAGAPSSCEVLVDFNEERVEFWDFNDPAAPSALPPAAVYANTGYVHSGWWSEDKQYVFAHDELDERDSGLTSTVRIFSLADLRNPTLAGTWSGPTNAIDHNGFVRGNRYYMSNYTRGLTILDISDPATPTEVGFFDTFGASNAAVFAGAWGAYPFLPSGTVAVSDINSGLYLLADRSLDVAEGSLSFANASFAASEGSQASIEVNREGGASGAASVDYEIIAATATGADVMTQTGTLNWSDGDAAAKTVSIDVVADAEAEPLEHALVRLLNPTGGATLGDIDVANLYLSDAGAAAELDVFADTISVSERGFARAVVVVQRLGAANGSASVDYAVAAGDADPAADYQGPASGTLNWAAGDARPQTIEYAILDDAASEADEFFDVSFSNAQGATLAGATSARVTIRDGSGSNTAPSAVAGVNQTVAEGTQVTLDGSMSNDPDGDTLSFSWTQSGGSPSVSLQNADTAMASFSAPNVTSDTLLQFRLDVSDPDGLTSNATVSITVTNTASNGPSGGNDGGGGGGGAPTPWLLGLLVALAARRFSRKGCAE